GDRLAPRRQVAAFAERDHLLGERLDRLCLRCRRLDPAVLDQRARKVRVERLAMRRVAAELLTCAVVPHDEWSFRWHPWMPRSLTPSDARTEGALGLGSPSATDDAAARRVIAGEAPRDVAGRPTYSAAEPSSPRSVSPCAASVSLTSSTDFLPKFGIAASSFSVFTTRSPIVSMPTRLRQLYERTPSSSSSIGKFSIPCASGISGCAQSPPTLSVRCSIRSMSVKIASCLIRISDACAIASLGEIDPSVVTSRRSLS